MNPPPFDHLFNGIIMERAYGYANENHIQINQLTQGSIHAFVYGSEQYHVQIAWEEEEYTVLNCTCPYDGGYCKHLAAVLLWCINEEVEKMVAATLPNDDKSLHDLLKKGKKTSLIDIIKGCVQQYPELESYVRQMLHDHKHGEDYGTQIQQFFLNHRGPYDGLDWDSLGTVSDYLNRLMTTLASSHQWSGLIDCCTEVISQINTQLMLTDDSNGILSDVIYSAFFYLEELINSDQFTANLQRLLYSRLIGLLDDKTIYDWDCGHKIWKILAENVDTPAEYQFLLSKMEASLKGLEEWSLAYSKTNMISTQILALHKLGLKGEAQQLIKDNLYLYDIRKVYIEQLIKAEDFVKANQVIEAGIQQAKEEDYHKVKRQFDQYLMKIAELSGDSDGIRKQALRQLFNHHFDMNNFLLAKKYTKKDHWPETLAHIIQKFLSKPLYLRSSLIPIYDHEGLYDEVLDMLDNDHDHDFYTLNKYTSKELINHDRNRLIDLYMKRIRAFSERASSRKLYRVLANQLQKVVKMGGSYQANAFAEELRQQYPRRHAMLEELTGI